MFTLDWLIQVINIIILGKSYRAHLLTGKSYEESKEYVFVFTIRKGRYFIPTTYNPKKHLILVVDEIPEDVDIEFLLSLCGDTDIKLENKGGHTVIRALHIVFCSNIPWDKWFGIFHLY